MENNEVVSTPAHKVDTHSYKGWLNSDSFLKRAFAIYGYNFVAGMIISLVIIVPIMLIVFMIFGAAIFGGFRDARDGMPGKDVYYNQGRMDYSNHGGYGEGMPEGAGQGMMDDKMEGSTPPTK